MGSVVEAEVLKLFLENWPAGAGLVIIVYFVNKFFGWLAPIVEMYMKAQVAWGETSTRTLAEMNELMRIVDTRLAALEEAVLGVERQHRSRTPRKND